MTEITRKFAVLVCVMMLAACAAPASLLDQRREFEQRKSEEVERLLASVVGEKAVRAQVSAETTADGIVKSLSVAVLVDYLRERGMDGEEDVSPRSFEELESLTFLVQSAVGFDAERGDNVEVMNVRFIDQIDVQ
ncbi:MAG: flagellar M-ring protein FliF C-terminal domain-containing protein [Rhodospirillales bacterium]